MQVITSLTSSPNQFHELVLEDNKIAKLTLRYYPRMFGWFCDIEFQDIVINNMKLVLHPNILRQFKSKLPFGLAIYVDNGSPVEPFQITDFQTRRVNMAILNEDEIQQVESEIFNVKEQPVL